VSDPYFDNVTLLLHCDGADGSTTFTDVKGHTVTPAGNAQIDTAQSKFGGASGLFDGTGDYLSIADSADWALGSGDWTIECWVRLAAAETAQELITQRQDSVNLTDFWLFRVESDNTIRFYDKSSNSVVTDVRSTSTLSSGQWYHVAAVRASGSVSLYVGGVKSANATTNLTSAYSDKVHPLYVATSSAGTSLLQGHLDDIRITKGVARYTTNFTPPAAAFPDSALRTLTLDAGAYLSSSALTITASANAAIQKSNTKASTLSAAIQKAGLSVSATSGALLQKSGAVTVTAGSDLGLRRALSVTAGVDSLAYRRLIRSGIDARLGKARRKTQHAGAVIGGRYALAVDSESLLTKAGTQAVSATSALSATLRPRVSMTAAVQRTLLSRITAGAYLIPTPATETLTAHDDDWTPAWRETTWNQAARETTWTPPTRGTEWVPDN
jgi:hypothetical protein